MQMGAGLHFGQRVRHVGGFMERAQNALPFSKGGKGGHKSASFTLGSFLLMGFLNQRPGPPRRAQEPNRYRRTALN